MDLSLRCSDFVARYNDLPSELVASVTAADNTGFLVSLSGHALNRQFSQLIFAHFEPIALDICARWSDTARLHTVAALGRVLPYLPQLKEMALCKLKGTGEQITDLLGGPTLQDSLQGTEDIRELLAALTRLLAFDNATFAQYIQPARLQYLLSHEDRVVRYLAIRVFTLYMHASDAALEQMVQKHLGEGEISGIWEGKLIDYRFWSLWEDKRENDFRVLQNSFRSPLPSLPHVLSRTLTDEDLSPMTVRLADTLFLRSTQHLTKSTCSEFVSTPTSTTNLTEFSHAIASGNPVLLTGVAGSGKTHLMNHVSRCLGHASDMITLHLNEQSDAKLLVGIYATGSEPGSFEWRPGVLSTAVQEGRWLFIEDIDRAPIEVLSTILPLIERREISIPSRGTTIRASANFRVFATSRTYIDADGNEQLQQLRMPGSRLWKQVRVQPMSQEDLSIIVQNKYSFLREHFPRVLSSFEAAQRASTQKTMQGSKSARSLRPITSRELLKWCERLSTTLELASANQHGLVPEKALDAMFLDAVDCFAGHLDHVDDRLSIASVIAQELHIDPRRRDHLLSDRGIILSRSSPENAYALTVGRVTLRTQRPRVRSTGNNNSSPFAANRHTLRVLERIAACVNQAEPVLLVGETGIGKTTAIQHLATLLNRRLIAINLSQQSESSDLLGGFKPMNLSTLAIPLKDEFEALFDSSFSAKKNQEFMHKLAKSITRKQWRHAVKLWRTALQMVEQSSLGESAPTADRSEAQQSKRRKLDNHSPKIDRHAWESFRSKLDSFERQAASSSDSSMIFQFVEGKLVNAVREGHWVLLDEINLATPDTLECLAELLEAGADAERSLILAETGKTERIKAHPNFRIFAAMNPSTDVGKKDLPQGIKSRFTEFYVDSPDQDVESLQVIINAYLSRFAQQSTDKKLANLIAHLYLDVRKATIEQGLVDGSNQPPVFSLRTLTRALSHAGSVSSQFTTKRAIFEGFSLCFFTSLDQKSERVLLEIVKQRLFGSSKLADAEISRPMKVADNLAEYVELPLHIHGVGLHSKDRTERRWLPRGGREPEDSPSYIITPYVSKNLQNLIRAASTRKYPVLIQGPTSAGKTSMIEYLAKRSGNVFVRINNHEHTDLQEYLGTYVSTSEGKIVFQEGVLVEALRNGYWVVLDELNLAPTDVLEALNRLLDDNRELLIPETQEVVRPHQNFMLFATQNPAGPYGGRKLLSRAFRNRFVELHFDDIPIDELNVILARRSNLPESWCGLIVNVYKELSRLRQTSKIFEQSGFATLRDLFRWAFRGADSVEELAIQGYMLLGEKARTAEERQQVKNVLETAMTRKGTVVRIDEDRLYSSDPRGHIRDYNQSSDNTIVWTKAMRRLYTLVSEAISHNEAILLVGETGCGKTTVCQMVSLALQRKLHIVNAHQNLETGDLIGAQRPRRNRAAVEAQLEEHMLHALSACGRANLRGTCNIDELAVILKNLSTDEVKNIPPQLMTDIVALKGKARALFEWQDGSIVKAMKEGELFLLDEISLADDSVLERLNSVLDPQRSVLLAEKGSEGAYVSAAPGFQFMATMNPGGDYGKKELSPALRNRFTEIWVPTMVDEEDVLHIVGNKLRDAVKQHARHLVAFGQWFETRYRPLQESLISLRDMLAWIEFINASTLEERLAIMEGAMLVYIDTLGANPSAMLSIPSSSLAQERILCKAEIRKILGLSGSDEDNISPQVSFTPESVQFGCFKIPRNLPTKAAESSYSFNAPTTRSNAVRIARGLQLQKSLLLEGNPGVGKTSIVNALARVVGKPLARLNLSEQTDLMDLFGSDAPVEGASAGVFAWRDAPFLSAMKRGDWVLLDEMNLASQSVLEGLNACLDHRAEVYIPELERTFHRHPEFRLFAAQNPHAQGGGRKGLPASFVNRFTVIYMDVLEYDDLFKICKPVAPTSLNDSELQGLIAFVTKLDQAVVTEHPFGSRGSPWEFNLRDCLRSLELLTKHDSLLGESGLELVVDMLFAQRFRTDEDRAQVHILAQRLLKINAATRTLYTNVTPTHFQIGRAFIERDTLQAESQGFKRIQAARGLRVLESMAICYSMSWPMLLIGPSGAGKTSLIQSLASLKGEDVHVFSLSADTDASDLVGGYEQLDRARYDDSFRAQLQRALRRSIIAWSLEGRPETVNLANLLSQISAGAFQDCDKLLETIRGIQSPLDVDVSRICVDYEEAIANVPQVTEARFEWIDGLLVKALQQGKWLVLDNVNLCSPSVLDRLNSLLEPGGCLIINEHCNADGSPRVIKPHPNFRLFLTMDHQYGEISRAMRNRSVELYIPARNGADENTLPCPKQSQCLLESSMMRFDNVVRTSRDASAEAATFGSIFSIITDHLTAKDVALLDPFIAQIAAGLLSAGSDQAQVSLNKCRNLSQTITLGQSWYSTLLETFRTSLGTANLPTSLAVYQPLHSLVNESLASRGVDSTSRRFALVHDTLKEHVAMEDLLEVSKQTVVQTKAKKGDVKYRYWSLLHAIPRLIRAWIIDAWIGEPTSQELEMFLLFVHTLWQRLHRIFQENATDISELDAYLRHGFETLNQFRSSQNISIAGALVNQIDREKLLQPVRAGVHMVEIWKLAHPFLRSCEQDLKLMLQIEAISQRFDQYTHSLRVRLHDLMATFKTVVNVFRIMQSSSNGIDKHIDLEAIAQSLGDESLIDQDMKASLLVRSANRLCQTASLHSGTLNEATGVLGLMSELSTSEACKLGLSQGCASILERISTYNALLDSRVGPSNATQVLLKDLAFADSAEIYWLERLKDETAAIGQAISVNQSLISSDDCLLLAKNLQDFIRRLLSGGDMFDADMTGRLEQVHHRLGGLIRGSAEDTITREISNILIEVGTLCIISYTPDPAFDPALASGIKSHLHALQVQRLENSLAALRSAEQSTTGLQSSERIRIVETHLVAINESQSDLDSPTLVYRPQKSLIKQLTPYFSNALRLAKRLAFKGQNLKSQMVDSDADQDLSQLIERLNGFDPAYQDIVSPLVGFLSCVSLGLRLNPPEEEQTNPDCETISDRLKNLTPLLGSNKSALSTAFSLDDCTQKQPTLSEAVHIFAFVAFEKHTSANDMSEAQSEGILFALSAFYHGWKRQLRRDQKEAEQASSTFTFRGGDQDDLEPDEEEVEEFFGSLSNSLMAGDSSKSFDDVSPQQMARLAAKCHLSIFEESSTVAECLRNIIGLGSDAIVFDGNRMSKGQQEVGTELYLRLAERKRTLTEPMQRPEYNIFVDSNITEVEKILHLLRKIRSRTEQIQAVWPEHATLQSILDACDNMGRLPWTESLMKVLPHLERLHATLAQWQSVASREFSLEAYIDQVVGTIVSWRRLELSTWSSLLDVEEAKLRDQANEWWFPIYENLLLGPLALASQDKASDYLPELLSSLEEFLSGTTLGQFRHRLRLVRSLHNHLQSLQTSYPGIATICAVVRNVIQDMDRFVPATQKAIADKKQELGKAIKDVILLASWKDTNVEALKQSSRISHRKLFRIVRKFQKFVNLPVKPAMDSERSLVQSEELKSLSASPLPNSHAIELPELASWKAQEICQGDEQSWFARPMRYQKAPATLRMMHSKLRNSHLTADGQQDLVEFVGDIVATAQELRKSTPASVSEGDTAILKHLAARKRRLFTETMKELRRLGLTSNQSPATMEKQSSKAKVLAQLPSSSTDQGQHSMQMYQVLDMLPQIRSVAQSSHDDLSNDEVGRAVGLFQAMLALSIDSTSIVSKNLTILEQMQHLVACLKGTWQNDAVACRFVLDGHGRSRLSPNACRMIQPILQVAVAALRSQTYLGGFNLEPLLHSLDSFASVFSALAARHSELLKVPEGLVTEPAIALDGDILEQFTQLHTLILRVLDENPQAALVLRHLERWTNIEHLGSQNHSTPGPSGTKVLADINDDIYSCLDACLSAAQDIDKLGQSTAPSFEDDKWLLKAAQHHRNLLNAFSGPAILKKCEGICVSISSLRDPEDLNIAIASLQYGLPLLELYSNAYRSTIAQARSFNDSLWSCQSRLGSLLCTVATQGFCKPSEPSGEKGDSTEKLEGGTGLGEGEGAENISKDIGDDEDLSELAQEETNGNQQDQQDGDQNHDAVDVQDDLKNAMGEEEAEAGEEQDKDPEEAEEEENDGENDDVGDDANAEGTEAQDQSAQDLDEGVGEVDDLEPSALDEKMWDDARDEDDDDKQTNQETKSKADEQAASKDNKTAGKDENNDQDTDNDDNGDDKVDSGDDLDASDAEDEHDMEGLEDQGAMDPHVQETENLDLPDDMQLDGEKLEDGDNDEAASDIDMMGDADVEDKPADEEEADLGGEDDIDPAQDPAEEVSEETNQNSLDDATLEDESNEATNANDNDGGMDDAEDDIAGGTDAQTGGKQSKQEKSELNENMAEDREDKETVEAAEDTEAGAQSAQQAKGPSRSSKADAEPPVTKEQEQMKRMGDMLEKWHRQHADIQQASEDTGQEEQKDVDMADADFEHLPDEDTEADTQALGTSTEEQARALNQENAVLPSEEDNTERPDTFQPQEASSDDEEMQDAQSEPDQAANKSKQPSQLQSRTQQDTTTSQDGESNADDDEDVGEPDFTPPKANTASLTTTDQTSTLHSWAHYESRTHAGSLTLLEQLRLILAPTQATKLRGDFRTGKRLNIKRIIPFIASGYKRDKIWLRRSLPSKRAYQVLLAIDDSKSMAGRAAALAFETLALTAKSLSMLEVGEIGVLGFGETVFDAHTLGTPFTSAAGEQTLRSFSFSQGKTDVKGLVQSSISRFSDARATARSDAADLWQLELIISDGICEDHEGIRRLLLRAVEARIMIIFVVVDDNDTLDRGQSNTRADSTSQTERDKGKGKEKSTSITQLERVEFSAPEMGSDGRMGPPKLTRHRYLDSFPFGYYLIVKDVEDLPGVLSQALRQWFAEVSAL